MTIKEAITHVRDVAERNRKQYKNCPADRRDIEHQTCEACAEQHEQLADWLEEIQQYRAIGTVDECRDAMERYRKRKPIILSEQSTKSEGKLYVAKYFKCPTCGNTSTYFGGLPNNCHNCGQNLENDSL